MDVEQDALTPLGRSEDPDLWHALELGAGREERRSAQRHWRRLGRSDFDVVEVGESDLDEGLRRLGLALLWPGAGLDWLLDLAIGILLEPELLAFALAVDRAAVVALHIDVVVPSGS